MADILLKEVIGFIAFMTVLFGFYLRWRSLKRIKEIPKKSTDELKSIISENGNTFLYGVAIRELKCRNEDYGAVLPHLIDLATSPKKAARILGWLWIREYFPKIEQKIEFNYKNPSDESISKLRNLKYDELNE